MPVTFLRTPADYFGIQEAPAQPLFQQTRALADPAVQNQLNFQDQITALRQQRPLARTQAIQNEYNAIFENANRLRQQQEAAKQAEQAVGALVGIAGDQPDYLEKKRAIQSQFPMAALDQRVQSLFNDNDRIYTARQSVEARRQEERERQAAELTAAGIKDVNEAYRIVDQGLPAVGAAKYQLGRGGSGGGENARLKMIKSGLDTLAETLKNTPEEIEESEGKYVPNPVRKTLLDKYSQYSTEYQNELDRALFPQAKAGAGGAGAAPLPQAEPQVGFKERMKGLAGGAANTKATKLSDSSGQMAIQPLSDEEVNQQFGVIVESGSPDEVASIATSKSPNLGDNIRKKAVERLQQFLKENPRPDDTLNTFFARKESIQKSIRDADEQLARNPIRREYKAAQDVEMKAIDDAVAKMATDLGLDKQMIVNTLSPQNNNGSYKLPSSIVPDRYRNRSSKLDGKIFIKDLAAAYVADEIRKIGELKPSKATYLSLNGREPMGMQELDIALPPSYSKFKSSKIGDELVLPETVSDLLVKYIDSRANMSSQEMSLSAADTSPQNQVAQPTPTLNVKNVRVKPPEQP